MTDYSERELYEITQLARLKFLGEEVAKQVMTEDDLIIALMACLKYIDLKLKIDRFGKFEINKKQGLVSKKGFILPLYDAVWSFRDNHHKNGVYYRARVKNNHFYGGGYNFVNEVGEIISEKWWNWVGHFKNRFARVERKTDVREYAYNFINTKGELLSNRWYQSLTTDFSNGIALVRLDEKRYFIDTKGEPVNKDLYDNVWRFFDEGVAKVEREGKFNFINRKLKPISAQWYDKVWLFGNRFAKVELNGKFNFINKNGKLLSKIWLDDCRNLFGGSERGYVWAKINDKIGWLDKNGDFHENNA
jgi:hypothetical protein